MKIKYLTPEIVKDELNSTDVITASYEPVEPPRGDTNNRVVLDDALYN